MKMPVEMIAGFAAAAGLIGIGSAVNLRSIMRHRGKPSGVGLRLQLAGIGLACLIAFISLVLASAKVSNWLLAVASLPVAILGFGSMWLAVRRRSPTGRTD
jgi:hypothetical protein